MKTIRLLLLAAGLLLVTAFANAQTTVTIKWNDNSTNEKGFIVERALATGPYTVIATTGPNTTSYLDTSVAPSTTYRYYVAAFNDDGKSGYSNVATTTTRGPGPAAPSGTATELPPPYVPPTVTLSNGESITVTAGRIAAAPTKPGKGNAGKAVDLTEVLIPTGEQLLIAAAAN